MFIIWWFVQYQSCWRNACMSLLALYWDGFSCTSENKSACVLVERCTVGHFFTLWFFYTVRNLGSTTECDGCVVLACFEKNLVFYCKIGRKCYKKKWKGKPFFSKVNSPTCHNKSVCFFKRKSRNRSKIKNFSKTKIPIKCALHHQWNWITYIHFCIIVPTKYCYSM